MKVCGQAVMQRVTRNKVYILFIKTNMPLKVTINPTVLDLKYNLYQSQHVSQALNSLKINETSGYLV